jgi:aldehyde:ferredoxin oxidoreductase
MNRHGMNRQGAKDAKTPEAPPGYVGRLLRVDLTQERIAEEPLPPNEVLRAYIGGTGLGVWLLMRELPEGVKKATDPANPLIFITGPLTGTIIPTAADLTIVTLNFDVGYAVATSHTHGFVGALLKRAGYDGLIVSGAATRPTWLWIDDGRVELRDAADLWGKDTHETEDAVRAAIGNAHIGVAAIGPAGENLVHGAGIENDYHHMAASGGVGAIMGSKRLKAIAVRGTGAVRAADARELGRLALQWTSTLWRTKVTVLPRRYVAFGVEGSRIAAKNLDGAAVGAQFAESVEKGMWRFKIQRTACFSCPIACTYRATVTDGPYKGYTATLAGGGENMEGSAGMVGVMDPGTVMYMTDLCDRFGFNSSDVGITMGMAFECYEKGLLTKERTGGLELTWGNADAAITLIHQMARRQGFGAVLADGAREAAHRIHPEAEKYLVHVKGTGFNLHDWRIHWAVLLGQCVSQAGGCWQGGGMVDFYGDPDLGYEGPRPIAARDGTPEATRKSQMRRLWEDSIGVCLFSVVPAAPGTLALTAKSVAAATGWSDLTAEEALLIGERIINLERIFSNRRGRTLLHDLDVGQKLLQAPKDGKAKGIALGPHLKAMVQEYYGLMGWDTMTGAVLPATLARLGLQEFAGNP